MELLSDKPERRASGAVPRAAKANRPLFYAEAARKRKALTVAEVHGRLDTMIAQRVTRYASIRRGLAPHAHPPPINKGYSKHKRKLGPDSFRN